MKLTLRACSSLNTTVIFFRHVFELLASIMIGSFYCFQILKTQDADVCTMVCMKFLADFFDIYLYSPLGADKVSVGSYGSSSAHHDEGDGLILCE
jgi:hypothetical protein